MKTKRSQTHKMVMKNRPMGTTQRVVRSMPFRDTVVESITDTSFFRPTNLLPGLSDRVVVFRKIFIEFLPETALQTAGTIAQVAAVYAPGSSVLTSSQISSGTAKVLSRVNPTNFIVDFDVLAKSVPGIKFPISSDENNTAIVSLILNTTVVDPLTVRITSIVDVFPQVEI